jgi:NADH:ubiquinone oxidoreductase subunit D
MQDMGASGTPLMYGFREREKILDLFEALTGARMMCNYMRFGGCRCDTPPGWLEEVRGVVDRFPRFLDEFENLLSTNEILMSRTQGIGVLTQELAINAGDLRTCLARLRGGLRHAQGRRLRLYPRFRPSASLWVTTGTPMIGT